jgi:O-antigen/teichoic acid export membrane protein
LESLKSKFSLSGISALQIFQLARFGATFLCAILLVKFGANQSQIAVYEAFLWLTGMSTFFWVGGSVNALLSVAKANNQLQFLSAAIWLGIQAFLAAVIVFVFPVGSVEIKAYAALFIVLNSVAFLNEYLLFIQRKNLMLLFYAFATSCLQLLLVVGFFFFIGSIQYSILGLLFLALLKFGFFVFLLFRFEVCDFSLHALKQLAMLSFPLSMAILVSGSAEYIDGFLVKHFFSDVDFALFRYGSRELPLSLILANTLSAAMISPVAINVEVGLESIKAKSLQLMHLLFPLSILLMLIAKPLLIFLYNESYQNATSIFRIMLLLLIPRLLFPQTVLTALKRNNLILVSATLELVLNVSFSLFFIQFCGLKGVVWGTVLAYVFDKFFLMFMLKKQFSILPQRYLSVKPFVLYSVLLLSVFVLVEFLL